MLEKAKICDQSASVWWNKRWQKCMFLQFITFFEQQMNDIFPDTLNSMRICSNHLSEVFFLDLFFMSGMDFIHIDFFFKFHVWGYINSVCIRYVNGGVFTRIDGIFLPFDTFFSLFPIENIVMKFEFNRCNRARFGELLIPQHT